MKKIYLNKEFECSMTEKSDTVQWVETEAFEGKCDTYIEGYRYIPEGQSWVREDKEQFSGEMLSPFKDSQILEELQALHEEIAKGQEAQNAEIAYIGMMTEVV